MRRAYPLPRGFRFAGRLAALWLVTAVPSAMQAQPRGGRGYLFDAPAGALTLRVGASQPQAASALFDFVARQLTLERGDYAGAAFAADLTVAHSARIETVLSVGVASRRAGSEYRDFVDTDDQPIEQRTAFRRVPMTAGLRLNLLPSGRQVSRLAWVPATVVPYVAAGGGITFYRFHQEGDFIDFKTNDVFPMTLSSSGWAPSLFGAAGLGWRLRPGVSLVSEVRYDRSRAPLGRDFDGFDRIDLSAIGLTAGFQFHF